MHLRFVLLASLAAVPFSGCGDTTEPALDSGPRDSGPQLDSTTDSSSGDTGPLEDGGPLEDTGPLEDGGPLDVGADAPPDGGPDAGPGIYVAVAGARCTPQTRIGAFSLQESGPRRYLYGTLNDSPRPEVGEPEETSGACAFYQANLAPCECAGPLVCTHDRERCVAAPARMDISVEVQGAAESHMATTMNDGQGPLVAEEIPLSGDSLGMTVTTGGTTITVDPVLFPTRINVEQDLMGSYDAPVSMDLTWTPEDTDITVYSLTNINHHVAQPTFTECAADASVGAIHIPGSMLVPLSVSTGLEFQQVESIRFAAAELPQGCVEFRFSVQ